MKDFPITLQPEGIYRIELTKDGKNPMFQPSRVFFTLESARQYIASFPSHLFPRYKPTGRILCGNTVYEK